MLRMKLVTAIMCVHLLLTASQCWVAGFTCETTIVANNNNLSEALGQAQVVKLNVCIKLPNGVCNLATSVNATFTHVTGLAFIGADNSTVQCTENSNVGLAFMNSSGIVFEHVTFKYCGFLHNSTSRNLSAAGVSFVLSRSALYFSFCSTLRMTSVVVTNSYGSGVVMYNTGGFNEFNECIFELNLNDNRPAGSGVIVDFSYCAPGDVHCHNRDAVVNVGSHYLFRHCLFHGNTASSMGLNQNLIYPHGSEHMMFGKGGGVSIGFGGHSVNNFITFDSCDFDTNFAETGGGLYASFADTSINNSLTVFNSTFFSNTIDCTYIPPNKVNVGGGAKIDMISYPPDPLLWPGYESLLEGNTINFSNSTFDSNIACYGGAVSFVTSRNLSSNNLLFNKCVFSWNKAQLSSAVDLSLHYPDHIGHPGLPVQPQFTNCTFKRNHVTIGNINSYALGAGALYSARVPLSLAGHNTFKNNDATALVVLSTYVNAVKFSVTDFIENSGRLGAAIAFIGNSWLLTHNNSTINFINNSVKPGGFGGAIYSAHFGEHDFAQNCFLQFHKPTMHPRNWTSSFIFTNNSADGSPNSIYTTSSAPCKWPVDQLSYSALLSDDVFCDGHPWYFTDSNCSREVVTAPNTLNVPPSASHITAVPGWPTYLNVSAVDDYHHEIPTVLIPYPNDVGITHKITIGVNDSTRYISNDKIILYGVEGAPTSLLKLRTLDPRVIVSERGVDILLCPPGFISVPCSHSPGMTCDCVCPSSTDGLDCTPGKNITMYNHYCLTYQYNEDCHTPNKSLPLVIGKCPYNNRKVALPLKADYLNDVVCGPFNRTGLLCSECKKGQGVAINGIYECVPCNPSVGWLIFLAVKIVPVTILFLLIAMFNFKATSPSLNAVIFYGQIVSVSSYHNPYPFIFGVLKFDGALRDALLALVEAPYGILNLDFFRGIVPSFCVGNINTLQAMAINYVVALYPILLIASLYISIKLYDRDVRVVRFLWKPFKWCLGKFHRNRKQTTSIIDAIASYILFSFTSIMYVSFPLLAPVSVLNAQESDHPRVFKQSKFYYYAGWNVFGDASTLVIFVIVVLVIGVFIVAPPLFFLLYPLKCMQRCISRLPRNIAIKTFAESFTESFRNGTERKGGWDCRYFAGLYFLFRIAILAVFMTEINWLEQYFIQQVLFTLGMLLFALVRPYKKDKYNHLDTSMFALLALLNGCSFYNSQTLLRFPQISLPVFIINYALLFIPLFYVIILSFRYCVVRLHCLSRCYKKESATTESIIVISEPSTENNEEPFSYVYNYEDLHAEQSGDFADRVLNPQNYQRDAYYVPRVPRITVTKATNERDSVDNGPMEVSTEQSYFRQQHRQRDYGSTRERNRSQTDPKPRKFQRFV